MDNCLDRFAFIKTLKPVENAALFAEGMQNNYSLEEDDDSYMKYVAGAKWENHTSSYVNELTVGTVFIGISKTDSMSREYIIVAKDNNGNSIWYPFSGYEDAEPVVMVYEFNPDSGKFVPLCINELRYITEALKKACTPGRWYVSTTVNGELCPIFEVEQDDDDDEWVDDDDDDDDDVEELQHEAHHFDDDDDDFGTVDCVFSCLKQEDGKLVFKTVAQIMSIHDDVEELQHEAHHVEADIRNAKINYDGLTRQIQMLNELGVRFESSYNDFQAAASGKFDIMTAPEFTKLNTTDDPVFDVVNNKPNEPEETVQPVENTVDQEPKVNELGVVETDIIREARNAITNSLVEQGSPTKGYDDDEVYAQAIDIDEKPKDDPFGGW